MKSYPVYKGLQKPLVYKGFKGRFIAWAIGSIIFGILTGGLFTAIAGPLTGLLTGLLIIAAGLGYTFFKQKEGLHSKTRVRGIFIHPIKLKTYEKKYI